MSLHSWLQKSRSALTPRRGQPKRARHGAKRAPSHRPTLEVLEDRTVPTFLAPVDYSLHWYATEVQAGDFNGDGIPDLVTVTYYGDSVSVLLSNGDGTFQAARTTSTATADPHSLVVGDFNQDGKLDLATANSYWPNSQVNILLGRGDGTFVASVAEWSEGTISFLTGDLNGDGTLDLVTTSVSYDSYGYGPVSTSLSVLLGNGDGSFARAFYYEGAVEAGGVADFDGDGNADVVAVDWSAGLVLFRGNGDGTLQEPIPFDTSAPWPPSAAFDPDLNADGNGDAVYTGGGGLAVSLGNGDGSLAPPIWTSVGFSPSWGLPPSPFVADFNADGLPDAAVIGFSVNVAVLINDGVWPPDDPPSARISDAEVAEGDNGAASATFTVTLLYATDVDVTVHYATADDTAVAGSDYQAASGTLIIPAGQTTGTITLTVNGDTLVEPTETLSVRLSNAGGATIADDTGIGTIITDDFPLIRITDVSKQEGKNGNRFFTFTVTLSAPSTTPVTVHYASADGSARAGEDYYAASGTLTFAPGETSKTISIKVKGDKKTEADETFFVNLSGVVNALLEDGQGLGTILNDD